MLFLPVVKFNRPLASSLPPQVNYTSLPKLISILWCSLRLNFYQLSLPFVYILTSSNAKTKWTNKQKTFPYLDNHSESCLPCFYHHFTINFLIKMFHGPHLHLAIRTTPYPLAVCATFLLHFPLQPLRSPLTWPSPNPLIFSQPHVLEISAVFKNTFLFSFLNHSKF